MEIRALVISDDCLNISVIPSQNCKQIKLKRVYTYNCVTRTYSMLRMESLLRISDLTAPMFPVWILMFPWSWTLLSSSAGTPIGIGPSNAFSLSPRAVNSLRYSLPYFTFRFVIQCQLIKIPACASNKDCHSANITCDVVHRGWVDACLASGFSKDRGHFVNGRGVVSEVPFFLKQI